MKKSHYFLLYGLGISLWIPGIAILNIAGAWGLQVCIIIVALLFIMTVLDRSILHTTSKKINVINEIVLTHFALLTGLFLCTVFSSLGVEKSILSFSAEVFGVFFSFVVSLWLCKDIKNALAFFQGFWICGIASSVYAMYQLVGLRRGLPFSYIDMNNLSFSILDLDGAIFHNRALGITAEPSIFASLITIIIGMSVVNLLIESSAKGYFCILISLLGLMATASQSIVIIPIYVAIVFFVYGTINNRRRKMDNKDIVGILILILCSMIACIVAPDITNIFSRILEIDPNAKQTQSATSRFYDVIVFGQMFLSKPLFGQGLGSTTALAETFRSSLSLDGESAASSSFFRSLAEQGLVGIGAMFIIFMVTKVNLNKIKTIADKRYLLVATYSFVFIVGIEISLMFFVGYRSVYHTWLLIPMLLCLKSYSV
jgi:O-Antigen ligase